MKWSRTDILDYTELVVKSSALSPLIWFSRWHRLTFINLYSIYLSEPQTQGSDSLAVLWFHLIWFNSKLIPNLPHRCQTLACWSKLDHNVVFFFFWPVVQYKITTRADCWYYTAHAPLILQIPYFAVSSQKILLVFWLVNQDKTLIEGYNCDSFALLMLFYF